MYNLDGNLEDVASRPDFHAPGAIRVHCGVSSPGEPSKRALRSEAECSAD